MIDGTTGAKENPLAQVIPGRIRARKLLPTQVVMFLRPIARFATIHHRDDVEVELARRAQRLAQVVRVVELIMSTSRRSPVLKRKRRVSPQRLTTLVHVHRLEFILRHLKIVARKRLIPRPRALLERALSLHRHEPVIRRRVHVVTLPLEHVSLRALSQRRHRSHARHPPRVVTIRDAAAADASPNRERRRARQRRRPDRRHHRHHRRRPRHRARAPRRRRSER